MLNIALTTNRTSPLHILCLGAHSDDLEIGCGGTLRTLIGADRHLSVHWVVFSATGQRATEAQTSATRFLDGAARTEIIVKNFRDGFFPYLGYDIKEFFEELKRSCSPDLIFTHFRDDRHQDHRLISDLTWNTYRDHLILEYEIPKYDGDLASPNFFVPIEESICRNKVRWITEGFQTQHDRHWFTEETFTSLMRLRGIESGAPSGYAEGFFCRKAVLGTAPGA